MRGGRSTNAHRQRRTALLVLLFQALLWIAGPSVEALVEARAADVVAHVENEGSPACPPIHSHLECQICRTLRTGATTTASVMLAWRTSEAPRVPATLRSGAARTASTAPLGARAPPVA